MRQTILDPVKLCITAKVNISKPTVGSNAPSSSNTHIGLNDVHPNAPVVTPLTSTADGSEMATAQVSQPGLSSTSVDLLDEQHVMTEKEPVDTWASLTGKHHDSLFVGTASECVSQVRPIFLAYKKVSWEGHRIPIANVATVVTVAIESADQIDGIQAMKAGWNIYMKSEVDRAALLLVGINLMGKHVSLAPSWHEYTELVKIIIKDLPLHKVLNQDVLAAVKELFSVLSDVKYSNVFVDGRKTICKMETDFCTSLQINWIKFQPC